MKSTDVAIAIPTFGRDRILVDTIRACLDDPEPAGEIIVVDQTPAHDSVTASTLQSWHDSGQIRWERQTLPSVPKAMNHALLVAALPIVLFLDDDIVPERGFIAAHAAAYQKPELWAVVGQIIQPWQTPDDFAVTESSDSLRADLAFPFHSTRRAELRNVMAGHLSVDRQRALQLGGFDENFAGTAYRFETEFARRIRRTGGRIVFEPLASIRHLRAERGGTRSYGSHLTSASPAHGVGDYYFALLHGMRAEVFGYISHRMVREVCTKFHLRHPWYIPVKLLGEVRALLWAFQLCRRGPALIRRTAP